MRLFFKILLVLGIAIIGLFFAYNNGYLDQNNQEQTINNEKSQPEVGLRGANPEVKKEIKVDLSQQKMYLFENGKIMREFAISSGKLETPTPAGNFRVIHKQYMVYSKPTSCWLVFWVGFTMDGKYGIHETPICEGQRIGEDKMGTPDSAGCVRLKLGDAEQFYGWAEIETPVEIF